MTSDFANYARAIKGAAGRIGEVFTTSLVLPGLRRTAAPGEAPGIDHLADAGVEPPSEGEIRIRCVDYDGDSVQSSEISDLQSVLQSPRPESGKIRWINIDGVHPHTVMVMKDAYGLHTLAAEDVLHVPQRPRAETYDDHIFIVMRMVRTRDGHIVGEQVSIFLLDNVVITFQEAEGDVWDPIRARLEFPETKLRSRGSDFLVYALIDAIVDHMFPLLEHYGDELERLEDVIMTDAQPKSLQRVQGIRRELSTLRRVVWPTRELMDVLQRSDSPLIAETTRDYLRDVYTHAMQLIDILEAFRDIVSGLIDLYMSCVSNRMNEVMKVLTIMASVFIPITFLAGVYGMNFEHIPELKMRWAYPVFWATCAVVVTGLVVVFKRRRWL